MMYSHETEDFADLHLHMRTAWQSEAGTQLSGLDEDLCMFIKGSGISLMHYAIFSPL